MDSDKVGSDTDSLQDPPYETARCFLTHVYSSPGLVPFVGLLYSLLAIIAAIAASVMDHIRRYGQCMDIGLIFLGLSL